MMSGSTNCSPSADQVRLLLGLLDLTRLEDDASDGPVRELCARALAAPVRPAAVCVFSRFVPVAREVVGADSGVAVATVANFPAGEADARMAVLECEQAVERGADEVDMVFPWRALLDGDKAVGADLVAGCKDALGRRPLKVILESGMLYDPEAIRQASEISINAGADFLKTSTGKVKVGATPEAARAMLEVIRALGRPVGFKVSGGVRTVKDALGYVELAREVMGQGWVSPARFRIGASGLMDVLVAELKEGLD